MEKYYITSDKVGEFIQRMFDKGMRVSVDPSINQITITKSSGVYEWIKVFRKGSFEELCNMFDEQEA